MLASLIDFICSLLVADAGEWDMEAALSAANLDQVQL